MIGVFLAFGLTDLIFDKGGFASLVLLCGITVNSGIYLVSEWKRRSGRKKSKDYIRMFNKKIWPISLTIVSSIIGLAPFLIDGPLEVFWFNFAVGTITGLIFSGIAMLLFIPPFLLNTPKHRN